MWLMGTTIIGTHALGQRVCGQQSVRLDYGPFAMDPFRLDRIQPGALRGQQAQHDPTTQLSRFDPAIVRTKKAAHSLTDVPRGVVPNQQQGPLARSSQPITAPDQE